MSGPTILLPFQPATMSGAQLAAVSFLARYSGRTHSLYAYQLREWFAWCESNGVDPLVGGQKAHVELYIRGLGDRGLMDSSVMTMMQPCAGTSASPTSTASSAPTRRCMRGCQRSIATSPAPTALTGSSLSGSVPAEVRGSGGCQGRQAFAGAVCPSLSGVDPAFAARPVVRSHLYRSSRTDHTERPPGCGRPGPPAPPI